MRRRIRPAVVPVLFVLGVCACALAPLTEPVPEVPAAAVPSTPEKAYDAGMLYFQRGDYDRARREWNRCLAMASPDSPSRLDCMVALEKLDAPATLQH